MSSLQRSRSLRKPTPTGTNPATSLDPPLSRRADPEPPRHGSPSRLPTVKPLPVKPLTRSATLSNGSTRVLRSGQTAAGGGLSRTPSLRQQTATEPPARSQTSRYPPSTTATRPRPAATATRPTSSDGPASQTRRLPAHTRAKSTTTASTTTSSLRSAAPVLRPPSQTSGTASRPPSQTSGTATRPRRGTRTTSPEEKAAPAPAPTAAPRLRPAFSTLQQHYSPAKSSAPKPLTATFLAPPSPSKLPSNVAASAETSRLQTELLQLHLLHRCAGETDAQWRASAREKLGQRFAQLAAASRDVSERERAEVERANVLALRSWGGGGLEERIQTLDQIMTGLWTMSESGGRYARVVRRFEKWVDRMSDVQEARRDSGGDLLLQTPDVLFIGELDAAWKDECAGLRRRLDGWKGQLGEIGGVPGDENAQSSLGRMLENVGLLIDDMLAELDVMEDVEREALAQEDEWIERMNRDDDADDTPRAGAIWRAL